MPKLYKHIYLSPHYDDASLSGGGSIHRQVQAGEPVLVITICAAPPPDQRFSPFAQTLHKTWGDPEDVVATRRAEDQAALAILGADYVRLNFTDCIYRGDAQAQAWYYPSDSDIFGEIHPAEHGLSNEMMRQIVEAAPHWQDARLYAPLAVGHHVDHQLARTAAWQLWLQGWDVSFYEDYPYADPDDTFRKGHRAYDLKATLATWPEAKLQPRLRSLSAENLEAKINSIRAYFSQIPLLFKSETDMKQRVHTYALYVGEGSLAERIWIPGPGAILKKPKKIY